MTLAIDPALARSARLLLEAAGRRLAQLEHPAGYDATHFGAMLLREARDRIEEASARLNEGTTR